MWITPKEKAEIKARVAARQYRDAAEKTKTEPGVRVRLAAIAIAAESKRLEVQKGYKPFWTSG